MGGLVDIWWSRIELHGSGSLQHGLVSWLAFQNVPNMSTSRAVLVSPAKLTGGVSSSHDFPSFTAELTEVLEVYDICAPPSSLARHALIGPIRNSSAVTDVYDPNLDCTMVITAPESQKVRLEIHMLQLENNYDFLQVNIYVLPYQ
jgi:hypothetical protein